MMLRAILLIFWLAAALFAQTSVWKVTCKGKTMYIGGTVHMLRASDFPLPKAYEQAFSAADKVVFETDIGALSSPQTALMMRRQLMYGGGSDLKDVLKADTYKRLEAYAQKRNIPMETFARMKPPLVAITVMGIELQRLGMASQGVDTYFYERAKQKGMAVGWLESVQQQVSMMAKLGQEDPDGMIDEGLEEIGDYETIMTSILAAWRSGDAAALQRLGKKYLMHESPEEYRRLIVERNRRWMTELETMLKSPGTAFVLVGALHLVGPEGLLRQLRQKGCRVEQL